jgi:leader peptidase (prepilin peptidase)/N-methyltransferase
MAVELPQLLLAAAGLAWGLVADRIGARWPAHEDGSTRPLDWRTLVTAAVGGVAAYELAIFHAEPPTFVFLGAYAAVLVVLLATDLDQRLLPDLLTLPLIPYAFVGVAVGIDPFVALDAGFVVAVVAAIGLPLGLFVLSIPFGRGAIGMGDLKLLVSVGLLAGTGRALVGLFSGAILAAAVIVVLIAARRISLHSYVPYGPFLIIGVLWAIFGPALRGLA